MIGQFFRNTPPDINDDIDLERFGVQSFYGILKRIGIDENGFDPKDKRWEKTFRTCRRFNGLQHRDD